MLKKFINKLMGKKDIEELDLKEKTQDEGGDLEADPQILEAAEDLEDPTRPIIEEIKETTEEIIDRAETIIKEAEIIIDEPIEDTSYEEEEVIEDGAAEEKIEGPIENDLVKEDTEGSTDDKPAVKEIEATKEDGLIDEEGQGLIDDDLTNEETQSPTDDDIVDEETQDPADDEPVEEETEDIIEEAAEEAKPRFNLFKRLKEGLSKTKSGITDKVDSLLKSYQKIDEDLFEELEEILITADIGVQTTMDIVEDLRDSVKRGKISDPLEVKQLLMDRLKETLEDLPEPTINIEPSPAIILVVGVNGVGKTTSIAKMAYKFKSDGKKVLLAAGDTFRAAAIDQLKIWGDRVGVDVISHQEEADPAAVIYDAIQAAKARNIDVLICDTAGRLHNKKNLMNELGKIFKVVDREYADASKEILLVLDATTGQNAIQQAKIFKEVAQITGLILTKLDGTAKGGVVIGISKELNVPVKLIGVGEQMEDLQDFSPKTFISAIFGEDE